MEVTLDHERMNDSRAGNTTRNRRWELIPTAIRLMRMLQQGLAQEPLQDLDQDDGDDEREVEHADGGNHPP